MKRLKNWWEANWRKVIEGGLVAFVIISTGRRED